MTFSVILTVIALILMRSGSAKDLNHTFNQSDFFQIRIEKLDKNKDGHLSKTEWREHNDEKAQKVVMEILNEYSNNKDLNEEHLKEKINKNLDSEFERADANRDGKMTKKELKAYYVSLSLDPLSPDPIWLDPRFGIRIQGPEKRCDAFSCSYQ